MDGNLKWKASLGGIATVGVGVGTSPVLYKDLLIVQCDEDEGHKSFVVALDKRTGKQVWRTPRKVQVSWATPVLMRAGGRDELVTSGTEWIIAYAPATGAELWRAKGLGSNAVPSPVVAGDVVVLSAGYPEKLAMAIRAGGSGDVTGTPRVLWKYTKGTAYVPSPIAYGGYVYLVTDKGILTCLDARTGEVKYEGGRVPIPATLMASPVAFDGKILLSSMEGDTFVIKAGPVHEVLRTNTLGEAIAASPAIARGRIFIRGESNLYAIGPRDPDVPASQPLIKAALELIDEAFVKKAWHGPNLRGTIRGLSAAEAAWRPGPGRHSVWELVVHAAYWKYAVRRRLSGEKRGSFALAGQQLVPAPGRRRREGVGGRCAPAAGRAPEAAGGGRRAAGSRPRQGRGRASHDRARARARHRRPRPLPRGTDPVAETTTPLGPAARGVLLRAAVLHGSF